MADRKRDHQRGDTPTDSKKGWKKNLDTLLKDKDTVKALITFLFGDGNSAPNCFTFFVLNSMSTKPLLPIKIAKYSPHIILKLGMLLANFLPGLNVVVDTGSVITCGWAPFILAIFKAHRELVKSITYCSN